MWTQQREQTMLPHGFLQIINPDSNMPTSRAAFPPEYFDKVDPSDDAIFYGIPRMVVHIDDAAIETLTALYDELLDDNAVVLDLMSSWRSHLPPEKPLARVIGHGMNSAEMKANLQLDDHFVQNLNFEQELPFEPDTFDAVLCAVSVQYMQFPLEVFGDVYRVLKPGGVFILSFSNRCFPSKAISAWTYSGDADHISLVNSYFTLSAKWDDVHVRIKPPAAAADPLFMLWGYKPVDE